MVQSIEVYLQPPSPIMNSSCKLPSVKSLFPVSMEDNNNSQELPSIRLIDEDVDNVTNDNSTHSNNNNLLLSSPRLNVIEPTPDLTLSTSPYQPSPIMTFSSPSSTTSSMAGSPLVSPIQDGPFLLPPPDSSFRRCRSVSNASNTSSSSTSSSYQFTFRSLSEPPTLKLPSSTSGDEDDTSLTNTTPIDDSHPIFGPKRKRGRPPNASRPEIQGDSNWTFVKPTVWDVKHNQHLQQQQKQQTIEMTPVSNPAYNHHPSSSTLNTTKKDNDTPQFFTENSVMSDGINTFTTTNMNMALSIPKKKRGRKPKKQLAGNSCFVWRDLTAPRGANKPKNIEKKNHNSNVTEDSFNRTLLPTNEKRS